ncbi:tubulin-specific chaperone D-like isoform X1 [Hyperolius riggenbachi]|uniref:tubulin-specific chaperone D-like isoform X1 n=1 Tax=Hyperolius riggenbachi TaxID=752182 RepID=UPI0035A36FB9
MVADHAEREEDGSPEIVSSGNILGSFTESKQTQDLIVNLQMSCMEPVSREVCAQSFKVIMDNYQEQPHLLDPHLGWMLELLLDIIQDKSSSPDFFQLAITFLLIISKVGAVSVSSAESSRWWQTVLSERKMAARRLYRVVTSWDLLRRANRHKT